MSIRTPVTEAIDADSSNFTAGEWDGAFEKLDISASTQKLSGSKMDHTLKFHSFMGIAGL